MRSQLTKRKPLSPMKSTISFLFISTLAISRGLDVSTVASFLHNTTATDECLNTCSSSNKDDSTIVTTCDKDLTCKCSNTIDKVTLHFEKVRPCSSLPPACAAKGLTKVAYDKCNYFCATGKDKDCKNKKGVCSPYDCNSCICLYVPL